MLKYSASHHNMILKMKKSEQVYKDIKQKIVDCEYRPSSSLSEDQLVKEFNISRTPVREALRILEKDGFIQVFPNRGMQVTDINLKLIEDIFTLRELNEPFLTVAAIDNETAKEQLIKLREEIESLKNNPQDIAQLKATDSKLHWAILRLTDNKFMLSTMQTIYDHNDRIINYTSEPFFEKSADEHIEIIDAILEGNKSVAKDKARKHVLRSFKNIATDFYNTSSSHLKVTFSYNM